MAGNTTNYNLTKPLQSESYNVDVQNGNMDIIDSEIKKVNTSLSERVNISEVVTTPTANKILKLNSSSKLPASITGDADSVDGIQGNQIPLKTLSDITYYVNASTGLDTNDGLTSGTAFKTFEKAISMIPQIINHTYNIQCASGTYDILNISGFGGKGIINILGGTVVSENYKTNGSVFIVNNSCQISVRGFKANTNGNGFILSSCSLVNLSFCSCDIVSGSAGISCTYGFFNISNCSISNHAIALDCSTAVVNSSTWVTSANNNIGISCGSGGKVGKAGTQPSGTTSENAYYGGQII